MKNSILLLSGIIWGYFTFSAATATEIKIKDMNNTEINSMNNLSDFGTTLTPEKMEELKKQIETIKENQRKSEELLEELDNDQ